MKLQSFHTNITMQTPITNHSNHSSLQDTINVFATFCLYIHNVILLLMNRVGGGDQKQVQGSGVSESNQIEYYLSDLFKTLYSKL